MHHGGVQDSTIATGFLAEPKKEDDVWVSTFSHDPPLALEVLVDLGVRSRTMSASHCTR